MVLVCVGSCWDFHSFWTMGKEDVKAQQPPRAAAGCASLLHARSLPELQQCSWGGRVPTCGHAAGNWGAVAKLVSRSQQLASALSGGWLGQVLVFQCSGAGCWEGDRSALCTGRPCGSPEPAEVRGGLGTAGPSMGPPLV